MRGALPGAPRSGGCRGCGSSRLHLVLDLGHMPLCQRHRAAAEAWDLPSYPLQLTVCRDCWLAQLEGSVEPERIFAAGDYAYFTGYSATARGHAEDLARRLIDELELSRSSFVVELGSNDGSLLRHFVDQAIPCLGVEPAVNVAQRASCHGLPTWPRFFDSELAVEVREAYGRATLIVANNVLPHVPDPHELLLGAKLLLAPGGVLVIEFQNLLTMMAECQFDTIYHEHYSYLRLQTAKTLLGCHGLSIFHVEELPTHGGSLRLFAGHAIARHTVRGTVGAQIALEAEAQLNRTQAYSHFAHRVQDVRGELLGFLRTARLQGKRVAGYGAPGKATTLLNYCNIGPDLMAYTVDRNPAKQGTTVPGTTLEICEPHRISSDRPDYVVVLPWNLRRELMEDLAGIAEWGGQLVFPIPRLEVTSPRRSSP